MPKKGKQAARRERIAALRAEQKRAERHRNLITIGAIGAIAAGAAVITGGRPAQRDLDELRYLRSAGAQRPRGAQPGARRGLDHLPALYPVAAGHDSCGQADPQDQRESGTRQSHRDGDQEEPSRCGGLPIVPPHPRADAA
jgi:hypothetical protein